VINNLQCIKRVIAEWNGSRHSLHYICFSLLGDLLVRPDNNIHEAVCLLLGNSLASEFYVPTFRNTLSVPSSQADRTDSVQKCPHVKFRRQGITEKKAYNIYNTAKVWNQESMRLSMYHFQTKSVLAFAKILRTKTHSVTNQYVWMSVCVCPTTKHTDYICLKTVFKWILGPEVQRDLIMLYDTS
jgi:hypothetical protein